MRRRTYEVVPQNAPFKEPASLGDAIGRRNNLQRDIENIQTDLSDRDKRDPETGGRMEFEAYKAWRKSVLSALNHKQQEMRELKAWIGKQHSHRKSSEWSLLARAYTLLEQLGENDEEVERLLEDIEYMLPRAFLDDVRAEQLARAG